MFGYIIANKPELKIREYERYQQYYCGLCRALHQEYGALGQLSLSFDMTFLAMLLTALYEPETKEVNRRCVVHPLEKKPYLCNPCITYAAQMNLLLTYYKCADDWKDEKKLLKGAYGQSLFGEMKKLEKVYPDQCTRVKQCLSKTSYYEKRFAGHLINEQALDTIAAQSGQMMAEIFAWRRDEWEQELRRLGFYMGKYIYLLDAYDDLEQDQKKHLFNPLVSFQNRPDFDEWVYGQLMMLATEAAKTFEELPVLQDAEILRNILYAGIWTRYFAVKEKRWQKTGKNPSRQEETIDSRQ
jgi:hypothetical protein